MCARGWLYVENKEIITRNCDSKKTINVFFSFLFENNSPFRFRMQERGGESVEREGHTNEHINMLT